MRDVWNLLSPTGKTLLIVVVVFVGVLVWMNL